MLISPLLGQIGDEVCFKAFPSSFMSLLLTFELGCMPPISLSSPIEPQFLARNRLATTRDVKHWTCLIYGYRLMSDYEVTLVNDNSKDFMSRTTCCSANHFLVYVLIIIGHAWAQF